MNREQRIIDTFVYLADTLASDFDSDDLLHVLADRCMELLDIDAAGVLLAMEPDRLRAAASSSQDMSQLEVFEVAAEEGPSYDAYVSGRPVVVHDLAGSERRWPAFTPRATALGFAAGYGFPLRLRERTVGSFNLFQVAERQPLDEFDLGLAQGFADMAAIGLLQEGLLRDAEVKADQLSYALEARVTIEQAKGVLAERLSVSPREAFALLRKQARDNNRKLGEVAQHVVDGRLDGLEAS